MLYTDPSGEFIWGIAAFIAVGTYEMLKPGGWDGWNSSGKKTVNAGVSGLIMGGGGAEITGRNLLKYAGSSLFNRYLSEHVVISGQFGNWQYSFTPGIGFGADGLFYGSNLMAGFDDGTTSFSLGGGVGKNMWAYGGNFKHKEWGAGLYSTSYSGEHPQKVGGLQLYWPGGSFRLENDFFKFMGLGDGKDRWRTSAVEVQIGDFVFGKSVYTSSPDEEAKRDYNYLSRFWNKRPSKGTYSDGEVISSPFYIGLRNGSTISRFGINHPVVQDITQNGWHLLINSPLFPTPYGEYSNAWSYSGYYNPFSLY